MPPKKGLNLSVKPDKDTEGVLQMLKWNWKRRFQNLTAQIVYSSAEQSLKELKSKVPAKPENKEYVRSLNLAKITGLPEDAVGYAIQGQSKKINEQNLRPEGTILYLRAKRRPRRLPPEVKVLIEHSPWTLESLPFVPKKSDVTIVYRKVSARMVEKVAKQRRKDQGVWKGELRKSGFRFKEKKDQFQIGSRRIKALPDLAMTALNMEFGQGDTKPKPHWRTAISALKRRFLPNMTKNRDIARAVSDPTFKDWVAWPKKTSKRISVRVAKNFEPFQQKLGIKTQ